MKKSSTESGHISINGSHLRYTSNTYGSWTIDIRDIKAMGEYTDSSGPVVDDYFIAFIMDPDQGWLDASFYADGRDEVLESLAERFGPTVACGLCNSTDHGSRIWLPASLAGEPMFVISDATGILGRLRLKRERRIAPRLLSLLKDSSQQRDREPPAPRSFRADMRGLARPGGC